MCSIETKTENEQVAIYTDNLWNAAHDYEYAQISGTAVGILALGVLAGRPKSLAIQSWIIGIWTLYYEKKSMITSTPDESLYDFSSCGPMPYSIPELMAEVLG